MVRGAQTQQAPSQVLQSFAPKKIISASTQLSPYISRVPLPIIVEEGVSELQRELLSLFRGGS